VKSGRRKKHPSDTEILADYNAFRTARYHVHVRPSDWERMTKRTKAALLKMIELAAKAVTEGKL
jgi:hypothetical protein